MYNPRRMVRLMRFITTFLLATALAAAQTQATPTATSSSPSIAGNPAQSELLWQNLDAIIQQNNRGLDGTMGVAIMDLTDGRTLLLNPDAVFTQASSIKVAVLAELYRQQQQSDQGATGKARLTDLYTVSSDDLVADSFIMAGLTPGVTRVTNRDLATFMVAVSDNSATNVLIDRVGMNNVNALLDSLGLTHTRLQRKMMDVKAAQSGRENLSTPREMMTLLADLYRHNLLNQALTDDFFQGP